MFDGKAIVLKHALQVKMRERQDSRLSAAGSLSVNLEDCEHYTSLNDPLSCTNC